MNSLKWKIEILINEKSLIFWRDKLFCLGLERPQCTVEEDTPLIHLLKYIRISCFALLREYRDLKGRGSYSPILKPGIRHIFSLTFGWL